MTSLPEAGFVRLRQIIGDPKSDPPTPAIYPVSRSTWWAGVRDGRFPQQVRLSKRCVGWRAEDIKSLISEMKP